MWCGDQKKNAVRCFFFHADESQNKLKSTPWYALMRYIVVEKKKNPKWNNHVPFDSFFSVCFLYLECIFRSEQIFFNVVFCGQITHARASETSNKITIREKEDCNKILRITQLGKHSSFSLCLSSKMINWMSLARQSPSHNIIMASKWIINFFFIIHFECFLSQFRKICQMLKGIIKTRRCQLKLFHFLKISRLMHSLNYTKKKMCRKTKTKKQNLSHFMWNSIFKNATEQNRTAPN